MSTLNTAMLRAQLGAPEGACFIPELPMVYCVGSAFIYTYRWASSGRVIARSIPIADSVRICGITYTFRKSDGMLWPDGCLPMPEHSESYLIRSSTWVVVKPVPLDKLNTRHDAIAAATRGYYARKQKALARLMPEGFTPLPCGYNGTAAAYKMHEGFVEVIRPTTKALDAQALGEGLFKTSKHPIYGDVVIGKQAYSIAHGHLVPKTIVPPCGIPGRLGWAEHLGDRVRLVTPKGEEVCAIVNGVFMSEGNTYFFRDSAVHMKP